MKNKTTELDVDFIGGQGPLTKEEEVAISNYIRAYKAKHSQKPTKAKRIERVAARKRVSA